MGLFSNIFKSSGEKSTATDFVNPVTTELHSHLIFDVDDGVQTLEQAAEILSLYASLGYKKVITTPHIMFDFYKNGPENLLPKLETTRAFLKQNTIDIELEVAAEYMIDDGIEKKIEEKNLLTFGKEKKYVLVELPFMSEPFNFKTVLFQLKIQGYTPVLAHPERYIYYHQRKEKYEELNDEGVLLQLNKLSLIGYYSPQVQKAAEFLIEKNLHDFVGSDAHNIKHATLIKDKVLNSKLYRKACEKELLNNTL